MIGSDGSTHWLDAKTIADSPAREFDANIFSDGRVLRAPLPAVHAGSIVEYEIEVREKLPLLDAGVTRRLTVIDSVPHERLQVLIVADRSIELRTVARLIPESAIQRKQTSTGTQIDFEIGPLEARKNFEFNLPPEMPNYPNSSHAWQVLGWVYQHDTFGRRFQGNWDSAEAEACYRKAIVAEPEDPIAKADLAILLEHNAQGYRYGKGARLDEAIALYREVLKKHPTAELQQNLAVALLYDGQVDSAREETQKAGPERRTTLQSVIIALQQGPAKAIVDAQTAEPEPRTRALHLLNVSVTLMQLRRYDIANAIMTAAARLANSVEFQNRVEVLRKLKRYEDVLFPASDPRDGRRQSPLGRPYRCG